MCGIVGIVGSSLVNQRIYDALTVLQHRGQDAAGIVTSSDGEWTVIGRGVGGLVSPDAPLDFGNSGTSARLMAGIVTGHDIEAQFTGDESLSRRPMGRVLEPLKKMGLSVRETRKDTLPLTLRGVPQSIPIRFKLPVPSAQVKSSILLAGLSAPGDTTVIEPEITRDHTEKMLAYLGAQIEINDANAAHWCHMERNRKAEAGLQLEIRPQKWNID